MVKTLIARMLWAATLAIAAEPGFAYDPLPGEPQASDPLGAARSLIADKRWSAAIEELKTVNASGSADWNNLMGYSLRKARSPDFATAEKYYDEALRIDPEHRGALEYSGELYLRQGDLPKAEQRLATLEKVCPHGCTELTSLKKAIQSFKEHGDSAAQW